MIEITRNLVFIDLETTGVDTLKDRIIEYAFCKLFLDGEKEVKTGRLNPGIPIPLAATLVHGISDEDVKTSPTFGQKAKGILAFIEGCDLGGFNSNNFDFPLLHTEFHRAGLGWNWREHALVDCGDIYKIKEPRTLAAAYRFYVGKELDGAHGAEADILGTVDVFQAQLDAYFSDTDVNMSMQDLALLSQYGKRKLDMAGKFILSEDGKEIIITIGEKTKGKPARQDRGFLNWMLGKDFPQDTLEIARGILNGNEQRLIKMCGW